RNFCQPGFGSGAGGACNYPGIGLDGPPWGFLTRHATGTGGDSIPHVPYYGFYTLAGLGNVSNTQLRSSLSHVTFQYGTATDETHFNGNCVNCVGTVPDPPYLFHI